jgi:hypothetical protein
VTLADKATKDEAAMAPATTAPNSDEIIQSKKALSNSKMNGNTYIEERDVQSYSESFDQTMRRSMYQTNSAAS